MSTNIPLYPSTITAMFYDAYHNPNLFKAANGMLEVVTGRMKPYCNSQHIEWLRETLVRIISNNDDPNKELPVMLYGMICDAFNLALRDYSSQVIAKYPELLQESQNPDDIYGYLIATCSSMFLDKNVVVGMVTVDDVMRIFAGAVIASKRNDVLKKLSFELVSNIISSSLKGIQESSRKAVLDDIRRHFMEELKNA